MTDTRETTGRVLRLLSLLGSRPVWTGPELAERLGVTTRTVRRDIDRLRELGYPVRAAQGVGGGYQLGSGGRLPPLLLDDEEAVAIAVCLRLAAGTSVDGVAEPALRTLTKLDQVLPAALREQVTAIDAATVTLPGAASSVDADVLVTLAQAVRRRVRVRMTYVARDGARTERDVEPYRLVATGRRWYLLAWDLDREDWRTLRLDRMEQVVASTWTFRPREAPDAAAYVERARGRWAYRHLASVVYDVPLERLRASVPDGVGTMTAVDAGNARLQAGADSLDELAWHLVRIALTLGCSMRVEETPELRARLDEIGALVASYGSLEV